jgi:hypothetical protein
MSRLGKVELALTQPGFKPINKEDGVTDTAAKV